MIARSLLAAMLAFPVAWFGAASAQVRDKPVAAGEMAPDFTLNDQDGRKHTLSAERGKRPVVLVFYRGYW